MGSDQENGGRAAPGTDAQAHTWSQSAANFRADMAVKAREALDAAVPLWTRAIPESPGTSWLLEEHECRFLSGLGTHEGTHSRLLASVLVLALQHSPELETVACSALLGVDPPGQLLDKDNVKVEVSTEATSRPDLVLYFKAPGRTFEVPVEVKINCGESGDQLRRYAELYRSRAEFGIYLTRTGLVPSDPFFRARSWGEFATSLLQSGLPETLCDRPVVEAFLRYCVACLGRGHEKAKTAKEKWARYLDPKAVRSGSEAVAWQLAGQPLASELTEFVNAIHEGLPFVAAAEIDGASHLHNQLFLALKRAFDSWWESEKQSFQRWTCSRRGAGPADFDLDGPRWRLYLQTMLEWQGGRPEWIVQLVAGSGGASNRWVASAGERRQLRELASKAKFAHLVGDDIDRPGSSGWTVLRWRVPVAGPDLFTSAEQALRDLLPFVEKLDQKVFGNPRSLGALSVGGATEAVGA